MKKRPLSMGCLVVVILISMLTFLIHQDTPAWEELESQTVTVQGRVYQKEVKSSGDQEKTVFYLKQTSMVSETIESLEADTSKSVDNTKNIMCYLKEDTPEPEIGSLVLVQGTLKNFQEPTNPGQFNAPLYYQILRISFRLDQAEIQVKSEKYNILSEALYQLRRFIGGKMDLLLPKQEASIMKTMLLGEKGLLDEEIKGLYQRNGIAHILAISGLHISMIGMGLYKILRKTGLKIPFCTVIASVVIVLYGMMTGFAVSSVRAIAMFLLQMLAQLLGRTYDRITALAVAAVLVLISQPLYLFHSGFLFSFLCVLGISMILPVLGNVRKGKKIIDAVALVSVTLPVYLWFFYQMPVYSMLLNFVVLYLMGILMGAGMLMVVLSMIWTPLGIPEAWLITGILTVYEKLGLFAENLPFHYWTPGHPATWQSVIYVTVLIIVAGFGRTKHKAVLYQRQQMKSSNTTDGIGSGRPEVGRSDIGRSEMSGLRHIPARTKMLGKRIIRYGIPVRVCWGMILVAAIILTLRFRPELQVTFLDVGQGDCICLQKRDGTTYLTDGGSSSVSQIGKYRLMPFLKHQGVSRIKAVFVSHADSDHYNGITELLEEAELEGITLENLVLADIAEECKDEGYQQLLELAQQNGIHVQFLCKGQQFQDGELKIQCLHPSKGYQAEDLNETSMVLYVTYREFSMLLTGDVQGDGEELLTEELKKLKVTKENSVKEKMDNTDETAESNSKTGLTVLKVAHHGSKNSTSEEFLETVSPRLAIISCGANNRYGHPHTETLERLEKADIPWLCTKDCGAITVTVDRKSRVKVRGYIADCG